MYSLRLRLSSVPALADPVDLSTSPNQATCGDAHLTVRAQQGQLGVSAPRGRRACPYRSDNNVRLILSHRPWPCFSHISACNKSSRLKFSPPDPWRRFRAQKSPDNRSTAERAATRRGFCSSLVSDRQIRRKPAPARSAVDAVPCRGQPCCCAPGTVGSVRKSWRERWSRRWRKYFFARCGPIH